MLPATPAAAIRSNGKIEWVAIGLALAASTSTVTRPRSAKRT